MSTFSLFILAACSPFLFLFSASLIRSAQKVRQLTESMRKLKLGETDLNFFPENQIALWRAEGISINKLANAYIKSRVLTNRS